MINMHSIRKNTDFDMSKLLLFFPLGKGRDPEFVQTWISFTQVPSLVEIGSLVLAKKSLYFHYLSQCMRKGVLWHNVIIRRKRHKRHEYYATSTFYDAPFFHETKLTCFQNKRYTFRIHSTIYIHIWIVIFLLKCWF